MARQSKNCDFNSLPVFCLYKCVSHCNFAEPEVLTLSCNFLYNFSPIRALQNDFNNQIVNSLSHKIEMNHVHCLGSSGVDVQPGPSSGTSEEPSVKKKREDNREDSMDSGR